MGSQSLIALGSDTAISLPPEQQIRERMLTHRVWPRALGIDDASEIAQRRIAGAAAVRSALGPGELVTDDRPVLEHRAARGGGPRADADLLGVLVAIARSGLEEDRRAGPMLLWIESRQTRAAGDESRADGREALAEAAGLALARRERLGRRVARGRSALSEGRIDEAEDHFRAVLREDPAQREARFALAASVFERGDPTNAERQLRRLLVAHPRHAAAWNLLGAVHGRVGNLQSARRAFARALRADPFYPGALANAGLLAAAAGNRIGARRLLDRLHAISPLGISPEEHALADALRRAELRWKEAAGSPTLDVEPAPAGSR